MPKIKLSEVELYYELRGNGEPLVLIPGFASGAWSWAAQVNDLAKEFRVVTFDPRGIANSTIGVGVTVSIEKIAADISELLDALEVESAHILGISFGGFVAQEFALRFPRKLDKLILACTSYGGSGHVPPSMEVLTAFASTKGLNSAERIRQYLTMAFTSDFVKAKPEVVDEFCHLRERNIVPEEVYLAQLGSAMMFDTSSRISGLTAETLVLTGDRDKIVPMQNSVNLAAAIPNAKVEIVEGGSHMLFVEQPKKFNSIIRYFLNAGV